MYGGAFQVARQVFTSEIWLSKPAWRFKIRIFLIGKANHTDNGKFKRGQFHTSYEEIFTACHLAGEGIKKKTIQNAIRRMVEVTMLRTQKRTRGFLAIIVKYDDYQTLHRYKQDTEKATRRTETGQRQDTKNNNEKEGKEKEFDLLWDLWSSRLREYNTATSNDRSQGGKTKAKEKYMKLKVPIEQVENAINGYFQERIHTKEYPKHMVTWLNQGGYNDDYEIVDREKSDDERIKEYERLGYTKFKEKYSDDEYRRVKDLRTKQAFRNLPL